MVNTPVPMLNAFLIPPVAIGFPSALTAPMSGTARTFLHQSQPPLPTATTMSSSAGTDSAFRITDDATIALIVPIRVMSMIAVSQTARELYKLFLTLIFLIPNICNYSSPAAYCRGTNIRSEDLSKRPDHQGK